MVLEAAGASRRAGGGGALVTAEAGVYTERASTAPWTRPGHEFVIPWGMFTAAEFALVARRHMHEYGTTPEQLALVSATIRNNGHVNPEAVYYGRGPFTVDDILASRMVADPFHILDCSTTSEGGCALVMTSLERARDLPKPPVAVLGGGIEYFGAGPTGIPRPGISRGARPRIVNGLIGQRSAESRLRVCGADPRRRRRARALRPVLVRDHPPARGAGLLRPG